MPLGVSKVRVGVVDQEQAKRFWTDTLDCELVQDETYGNERWLEVRLPDGVIVVLEQNDAPDDSTAPGQPNTPLFLGCDDVDSAYEDLVARGVSFIQEPIDMPFGRWALFEDGQGNRYPLTRR